MRSLLWSFPTCVCRYGRAENFAERTNPFTLPKGCVYSAAVEEEVAAHDIYQSSRFWLMFHLLCSWVRQVRSTVSAFILLETVVLVQAQERVRGGASWRREQPRSHPQQQHRADASRLWWEGSDQVKTLVGMKNITPHAIFDSRERGRIAAVNVRLSRLTYPGKANGEYMKGRVCSVFRSAPELDLNIYWTWGIFWARDRLPAQKFPLCRAAAGTLLPFTVVLRNAAVGPCCIRDCYLHPYGASLARCCCCPLLITRKQI